MQIRYLVAAIPFLVVGVVLHAQQPDPLPKLVAQLKNKKAEKRAAALESLAELGPKAAPAIPALVNFLPGYDEHERILASLALAKIGKASLPAVEKLLGHEDETTRFYALWTIGLIGKDAKRLTPRVLAMFQKDEDEEVRQKAAYALARIAPDSKEVFDVFAKLARAEFTTKIIPDQAAAIEELRHFGPAALEPIIQSGMGLFLTDSARESISHIVNAHKTEATAKAVLPHLNIIFPWSNIVEPEKEFEDGLAWVLSKHGDKLLPELTAALNGKDQDKRLDAALVLGNMARILAARGENPDLVKKALKLVLPTLSDADVVLRRAAATCVPLLAETMAASEAQFLDEDWTVRSLMLWKYRGAELDPIPSLEKRFKAAKGDEKFRVGCALFMIEPTPERHTLLGEGLKSKNFDIRLRCASALAENNLGPDTDMMYEKIVAPIFLEALKSERAGQRAAGAAGLSRIPKFLKSHVPALLAKLDDPSADVKAGLLTALQVHAQVDAKASLKAIAPLLDHDEEPVRLGAMTTLAPFGKTALPYFLKRVDKDDSPRVWLLLCQTLAASGKDAESAFPALLRAAEDPQRATPAIAALHKIAPDKAFNALLTGLIKKDDSLRRALAYPKETIDDEQKLVEVLLRDSASKTLNEQLRVAGILHRIFHLLPEKTQDKVALAMAPVLGKQLTILQKNLKGKSVERRVESLIALGELYKAWFAFAPVESRLKGETQVRFTEAYRSQYNSLDNLITGARNDPNLPVRRQARKLHNELKEHELRAWFPIVLSGGAIPNIGSRFGPIVPVP